MEDQKQKRPKCCYCARFNRYYFKGLTSFEKTNLGQCTKHNNIVQTQDSCECWLTGYKKHALRKRVATRVLNELLIKISVLQQILEESLQEEMPNTKT